MDEIINKTNSTFAFFMKISAFFAAGFFIIGFTALIGLEMGYGLSGVVSSKEETTFMSFIVLFFIVPDLAVMLFELTLTVLFWVIPFLLVFAGFIGWLRYAKNRCCLTRLIAIRKK